MNDMSDEQLKAYLEYWQSKQGSIYDQAAIAFATELLRLYAVNDRLDAIEEAIDLANHYCEIRIKQIDAINQKSKPKQAPAEEK